MRLKTCLSAYAMDGFVAHQDIHPTLEWQVEIERALRNMDAFIAIHTKGFSGSIWTQQEIGFAVARDVKIISLKMGEDPTGLYLNTKRLHGVIGQQRRSRRRLTPSSPTMLEPPTSLLPPRRPTRHSPWMTTFRSDRHEAPQ